MLLPPLLPGLDVLPVPPSPSGGRPWVAGKVSGRLALEMQVNYWEKEEKGGVEAPAIDTST